MFELTATKIEPAEEKNRLLAPGAGALATFEGWVRDNNEGKSVSSLTYEAYETLANTEAEKILLEAREKFRFLHARAVHRTGRLAIGEIAVWVGVSSPHRKEAFAACQYIIDEIKHRLPIWKLEEYTDGTSEWVNCAACSQSNSSPKAKSEAVKV